MDLPSRWLKVEDVREMRAEGPWPTKSNARLTVLFSLLPWGIDRFFEYDAAELAKVPCEMRRLKVYHVRGIPCGTIGGTEFHRIRQEIIFGLDGEVDWVCEDLAGQKREFVLNPTCGIWMPPFILHTYTARVDGSGLLVIANTYYDQAAPETADTFSTEEFRRLQQTAAGG